MPKPALTRQLPMLGTRSRMTSQSSFCAEKAPAFEGRKPGALEGGKLHPPHCPSRKTTMSAITSTPAYLSAKARVAPGVSGARAAVARPAGTRRAFVVRASAEQKKGACAEVFSTLFAASGTTRRPARASTSVRRDDERVDHASAAASPRSPRRFGPLRPLVDRAVVIVFTATRRADDATRLSNPSPNRPPAPEGGRRAPGRHPLLSFHRRRRRGARSRGAFLRRSLSRASPPLAAAETV